MVGVCMPTTFCLHIYRIHRVADADARREWWNGSDEYFVLGDDPSDSRDSRGFGPVSAERITGRVWLRILAPGFAGTGAVTSLTSAAKCAIMHGCAFHPPRV